MNFLRRIWYSLRHRRIDEELAEEIESHRAMAQARLEQDALSAADAAAASQRLMGNLTLAREDARAERVAPWPDGGVLVVLAVAGAAATFVPARHAARIEPVNVLRHL